MTREDIAVGQITTALYTSPHATPALDPEPALLARFKAAERRFLISTYGWTLVDLADELIAKHDAGIAVRVVADATEFGIVNSQYPRMVAAGIDLLVWGSEYQDAHEKLVIVDDDVVCSGSYNLTTSAEKVNKELLWIQSGAQVARVAVPILEAQIQATYAASRPPPAA